jgi:1,2-diacylglycerol 3-beta-glucosyltransferase
MLAVLVFALFLAPATAIVWYSALLTLIGRLPLPAVLPARSWPRLTVLIPAHNEQLDLPETLASVFAADYPAQQLRIIVIADNCTDDTFAVAHAAGVSVLERTDVERRGKGHAVAAGIELVLNSNTETVLILDADCAIDRNLLKRVGEELMHAEAVQTAVISYQDTRTPGGYVAAVGSEIDHGVASGADRLGRGVPLRGTGMGFRCSLLKRCNWTSTGVTEDAEYTAELERSGVRVALVADAAVRCRAPNRYNEFLLQRRRWRSALRVSGGRLQNLLASKPLVLAHLLLTVAMTAALVPSWLGWACLLVVLMAAVYIRAMVVVGLPKIGLLAESIGVTVRLGWLTLGGYWQREREWQRTPRN